MKTRLKQRRDYKNMERKCEAITETNGEIKR
jgi:hypothetical protein